MNIKNTIKNIESLPKKTGQKHKDRWPFLDKPFSIKEGDYILATFASGYGRCWAVLHIQKPDTMRHKCILHNHRVKHERITLWDIKFGTSYYNKHPYDLRTDVILVTRIIGKTKNKIKALHTALQI